VAYFTEIRTNNDKQPEPMMLHLGIEVNFPRYFCSPLSSISCALTAALPLWLTRFFKSIGNSPSFYRTP
jgi:hypothetical protein